MYVFGVKILSIFNLLCLVKGLEAAKC